MPSYPSSGTIINQWKVQVRKRLGVHLQTRVEENMCTLTIQIWKNQKIFSWQQMMTLEDIRYSGQSGDIICLKFIESYKEMYGVDFAVNDGPSYNKPSYYSVMQTNH